MSVRITFEKMKKAASEVFGVELHRSGCSFRMLKDGVWLGEGHGTQFTLSDIADLFRVWINHPEAYELLSDEFKRSIAA